MVHDRGVSESNQRRSSIKSLQNRKSTRAKFGRGKGGVSDDALQCGKCRTVPTDGTETAAVCGLKSIAVTLDSRMSQITCLFVLKPTCLFVFYICFLKRVSFFT